MAVSKSMKYQISFRSGNEAARLDLPAPFRFEPDEDTYPLDSMSKKSKFCAEVKMERRDATEMTSRSAKMSSTRLPAQSHYACESSAATAAKSRSTLVRPAGIPLEPSTPSASRTNAPPRLKCSNRP